MLGRFCVSGLSLCISIGYLIGCSGGESTSTIPPPSTAPTITMQPASQTVPINRAATFTVTASGTAPLLYQWQRNGTPISGANASSYTTSDITRLDNNSTYSVIVSNAAGMVTSNPATLLSGPRAPALGDLRYLQLEQDPLPASMSMQSGFVDLGATTQAAKSSLGTSLTLGDIVTLAPVANCNWNAQTFMANALQNFTTFYETGNLSAQSMTYQQYLQTLASDNIVVFSMDYQPQCQQIAVAYTQATQTQAFDQRIELVDPAILQAQVAADGAASRIVTAATIDPSTGKIALLSYGWQGDTTTAYEAATFFAQSANVLADAEQLANEGYFISAFGGRNTLGYVIIGMRVMGDTMPRPYFVDSGYANAPVFKKGNQPAYPESTLGQIAIFFDDSSGENNFREQ